MLFAEIDVYWIREIKPDRVSGIIMWAMDRPYSHVAIHYRKTGMIWHCYDPGVMEEPEELALKGCAISARRGFVLKCLESEFERHLEEERGKQYGTLQLMGFALPQVMRRPFMNKDKKRTCSEFVGVVLHKYFQKLPGARDWWTPAMLEKVFRPERL